MAMVIHFSSQRWPYADVLLLNVGSQLAKDEGGLAHAEVLQPLLIILGTQENPFPPVTDHAAGPKVLVNRHELLLKQHIISGV